MKIRYYVLGVAALIVALYALAPPYFWPIAEIYATAEAGLFILSRIL